MINIGDRIIIKRTAHDVLIPGYKGTVVDVMFNLFGIEFDREIPRDLLPEDSRHDCGGRGKIGYCRYCFSTDFKLIEDDWDN